EGWSNGVSGGRWTRGQIGQSERASVLQRHSRLCPVCLVPLVSVPGIPCPNRLQFQHEFLRSAQVNADGNTGHALVHDLGMVQFAPVGFDRKDKASPLAKSHVVAAAVSAHYRIKASRRSGKVNYDLAATKMNPPSVLARSDK